MKILLVGNYLPDRQKSMFAFAQMMERILVGEGHIVEVINPPVRLLPEGVVLRGLWKWVAYLDKYVFFPFMLRRVASKFDLVHICDHSNALYTLFLRNHPTIVTCHDVLAIEAARNLIPGIKIGLTGKVLQWLIFKGLNRATSVVCDSKYTKEHLIKLGWCGMDVSVALLALNEDFSPVSDSLVEATKLQIGLQPSDQFFVHVGSDLPRKNRLFVLKVFNELRRIKSDAEFKLLFVGPRPSDEMNQFIQVNQLGEAVITIQDAPHAVLKALYGGALAQIFPSLQEGFGWPIIEAQACGCPVFTSNLPPMTEVGGNAAIYIDPYDAQAAAQVINSSLSNLESTKLSGFENVRKFSIQNMMSIYASAYERIMDARQ